MTLQQVFQESIDQADKLFRLYEGLLTQSKRAIRNDWKERFLAAKLTEWPKSTQLWRSKSSNLLLVGTSAAGFTHKDFQSEPLSALLRASLALAMASIDKVLHEAVNKHFSKLARGAKLDKIINLELSESYRIAIASRTRRGRGGSIKSRPGPKIKAAVLENLYRKSFLSLDSLEQICAACGSKSIIKSFAGTLQGRPEPDAIKHKWRTLYAKRNHVVHECDVQRRANLRRVRYNEVSPAETRRDLDFIKTFGHYLSTQL